MKARQQSQPLFIESQRRTRMMERRILLCPGPVMVSPRVKSAMMNNDLSQGEGEFYALLDRLRQNLCSVFGAEKLGHYATVLVNGSGSTVNESVFASLGSDQKVLVLCNGEFGQRLLELAKCHQQIAIAHQIEWGVPFSMEAIEQSVVLHRPSVIAMVHHETSTGMLNPIEEVGALAVRYGAMFVVDAVSSLAVHPVNVERNHISFCTSSSNLGLASISGVSFVCGMKSAFEELQQVKTRSVCLNLYRQYSCQTQRAAHLGWSSTAVLYALDAAVEELLQGGVAEQMRQVSRWSAVLKCEMRSMGLEFLLSVEQMSNVLTTVLLPKGITFEDLDGKLRQRGYIIGACLGPLAGKAFQVANIGRLTEGQVLDFARDLRWVLSMLAASQCGFG